MKAPEGMKLQLLPEDEYCHVPEAAKTYNESMYFNVFDPTQQIGGWFRIGNRVNEGYAEMSVCLYLPGGKVGFMFKRVPIDNNDELNAGGLRVEVLEPFKSLRVTYEGSVLLMDQPHDMADPKMAFTNNPREKVKMVLNYRGVSPMYGGEMVNLDGTKRELDAEKSFARAHYEQHVGAEGTIEIAGETWNVAGFGLRDKSWGPRTWQSIYWYRWCPMNFGEDFGMMVSVISGGPKAEGGGSRGSGMVLEDGQYYDFVDARIDAEFDEKEYQTTLNIWAKAENGKEYEVEGKVLSLIPLRNRRTGPDGVERTTRITEGMTEYKCNGKVGYGLSEFLDQLDDDGRAVSLTNP